MDGSAERYAIVFPRLLPEPYDRPVPAFRGFCTNYSARPVGMAVEHHGETGEVLLSILAVLMIFSFGSSILILVLLTGLFTRVARKNTD
ncbi:MAG: hypothetical protein HEQ21_06755 [Blastomonas sp.]|nr:hypothetical protein [Blastomonas sp.]